jgi:8-oxo-dGTP diphosphatase
MSKPFRISARAAIIEDDRILLIECQDADGLHYNFPGGGIEPGESLHDAVRREVFEETCAEVEVGRLLIAYEVAPRLAAAENMEPVLALIFQAQLVGDAQPQMPPSPDTDQIGIRWVPLALISQSPDFPQVNLMPPIGFELVTALRQFDAWNPHIART